LEIVTELTSGTLTLLVILDPNGVPPFFVLMTRGGSEEDVRRVSQKAVSIAAGLLLIFSFLGDLILSFLGIDIDDFELLEEPCCSYSP